MRRLLVAFLVALAAAPAAARRGPAPAAAEQFDRGQSLYAAGRYAEAIQAFAQANALSPHWSPLFNIARCYENLGNAAQALDYYRQALAATPDAASRADIERRIEQLAKRPVKVFVSTEPPGARVTVDGRAQAEPGQTPAVLALAPGEHLLLVEREGYKLAAKRIVVEMDKEQPVALKLVPVPAPCPPPRPPCPPPKKCPAPPRLVPGRGLHMHLGAIGAFALTPDRPLAAGPGILLHLTYRRFLFGGFFMGLPMGEEAINETVTEPDVQTVYTSAAFRWLLGFFEGGYLFPFRNAYAYATAGVGLSADRSMNTGTPYKMDKGVVGEPLTDSDGNPIRRTRVNEAFAVLWALGGGIEAMATPWLSFGVGLRLGMIQGDRLDRDVPTEDPATKHAFFGSVWGTTTFHL